jgi:hypothetical protein
MRWSHSWILWIRISLSTNERKRIVIHQSNMPPSQPEPSSPQLAAAAAAASEGQRLRRATSLVAAAAGCATTNSETAAETARSESSRSVAAAAVTATTTNNSNAHDSASVTSSQPPFCYTELLYAVNSFYAIVQPGTLISLSMALKHNRVCVRQSLSCCHVHTHIHTHSIYYHDRVGVGRPIHRHARIDRRHNGRAGTNVQRCAQLGSGYQRPTIGQ